MKLKNQYKARPNLPSLILSFMTKRIGEQCHGIMNYLNVKDCSKNKSNSRMDGFIGKQSCKVKMNQLNIKLKTIYLHMLKIRFYINVFCNM